MSLARPLGVDALFDTRRLVVKIGSALLVDPEKRTIRQEWLATVCADIAALRAAGTEIVVVTSGAVSLARRQFGRLEGRLRLADKQALASIGQVGLAQAWQAALQPYELPAAQLLLTPEDTEERARHLNARGTIEAILRLGGIPVINENDALATQELRFGDNDRLAARVAQMIDADLLVLLSDIDGLYTADPRTTPDARHLSEIPRLTDEIMEMGGAPPPGYSSGGMRTKLLAAQIATRAGTAMLIADGRTPHPLERLRKGARCTRFLPSGDTQSARKRWIASFIDTKGVLTLDSGAARALSDGASLLPAGVTKVEGAFDRGDSVSLHDSTGRVLGRGLAEYNSDDSRRLIGHRSNEIYELLGWHGRDVLVHHDDLVLD